MSNTRARERAHAPGSVTLLFAPSADPGEGSLGASFAVADGVEATVQSLDGGGIGAVDDPTDGDPVERIGSSVVTVDGEPRSFEPVERALDELGVEAVAALSPEVPIGHGFGASGAATLATALAADAAFDLERDRETLVEVAHRAEVAAGTGLGDVFVQSRGGLVWNAGDGAGVRRVDRSDRLAFAPLGELATDELLADEAAMDRVRTAGLERLPSFDPGAPLDDLLTDAWEFAREADLATDRVAETVARVEAAGGVASVAMIGETVIGTPDTGVLDRETRVTSRGARLLE
jgi:pantoate kinase